MTETWTVEQFREYQCGGEVKLPKPDATESRWQSLVEHEFERHGWLCYHAGNSRRDNPGFPDLVAVHPVYGLVFAELKTRSTVSEAQWEWIYRLYGADVRVFVWRFPADWPEAERVARGQ